MSSLDLSRVENLQQASCLHRENANRILQDSQRTDRGKKEDLATLQSRSSGILKISFDVFSSSVRRQNQLSASVFKRKTLRC